MKHLISWFEIPVRDMKRAQTFYEAVFGLKLEVMEVGNGLTMAIFPAEPGAIGGALCKHNEFYHPGESGCLIYLNANPSIDAILDRVKEAGRPILVPKRKISPEHGSMAVFKDSEENRIALHSNE